MEVPLGIAPRGTMKVMSEILGRMVKADLAGGQMVMSHHLANPTNVNGDLSCLSSTRQFKIVAGDLAPNVALANVMALRPQTGAYMETPDVPEHWLVAEDVAAVDPALAGLKDGKPYTVKTQNVVADLVAVIQQQQRRIDALERALMKR